MRPGGADGRRNVAAQVPQGVTAVRPMAPKGPASGTGSPLPQKPAGHAANTIVLVGSGLYPGPRGADRHVTRPAPRVGSCLHHLGHHVKKHQRGLGPRTQPARMLWRSPSLHLCHGKNGCKRRKTSRTDTPLLEEIHSPARLLYVWRAVASVTFQWLKKALSKVTPTLSWRRK